jgi:hypothetical protein
MKIEHLVVQGRIKFFDPFIQNLILDLEPMLVRKLFVEKMNYVMIIGFIIHVNVNHHILVNDVIKVKT